jgi:hypothetical protein
LGGLQSNKKSPCVSERCKEQKFWLAYKAAMKLNAIGKQGMNTLQTLLDSNYNKQAQLKYT